MLNIIAGWVAVFIAVLGLLLIIGTGIYIIIIRSLPTWFGISMLIMGIGTLGYFLFAFISERLWQVFDI